MKNYLLSGSPILGRELPFNVLDFHGSVSLSSCDIKGFFLVQTVIFGIKDPKNPRAAHVGIVLSKKTEFFDGLVTLTISETNATSPTCMR